MPANKASQAAILRSQEKHNRLRREARAEARRIKETVPREGACEEIVHKFVSGIITRLLKRKRNARARPKDPNAVKRVAAWRVEKKKEAAERGITFDELMKERSDEHKQKPLVFANPMARHKERMKTDEVYSVRVRLSRRLREFLRLSNGTKAKKTIELVGCTQAELIAHLRITAAESKKLTDESIDHIFPASRYDGRCPDQQRAMMNFTNLRMMPLYGKGGNVSKNDRLPKKSEVVGIPLWVYPPGVTYEMLED